MKFQMLPSLLLCMLLVSLLATDALAAPLTPQDGQAAAAAGSPARPGSVLVVTTFNPNAAEDDQCSLVEAIVNANDDAATHDDCVGGIGPDTIVLQDGVYTVDAVDHVDNGNNGLPAITSVIAIEGNGATVTRVAHGDADLQMRIFHVAAAGQLTLINLTISNGAATSGAGGGGIRNAGGTVTLLDCMVTGNTTYSANGGAILNVRGAVWIERSEVSGNQAIGGMGGGIFNDNGAVSIEFSAINLNTATNAESAARGGGLASRADGSSTAILAINQSVIASNTVDAPDGSGGGVAAWSAGNGESILALNDSLVWANLASHGGGLWIAGAHGAAQGPDATISRSAIVGNRASGYGSEHGSGAGIANFAATTIIANSTIAENAAAGIIASSGGGIDNASAAGFPPATLRLLNATVAFNSALFQGGGIANHQLGAGAQATVAAANTIVAANVAQNGANCWTNGAMASLGHNVEDADTCRFDQPSDWPDTDPRLDLLAANGGPTPTYALQADSPAIDAGDDAICAAAPVSGIDQRGVSRAQGATCDSGAFEVEQPPTAVKVADLEAASGSSRLAAPVYLLAVIWLAALVLWIGSIKATWHLARPGYEDPPHRLRPRL